MKLQAGSLLAPLLLAAPAAARLAHVYIADPNPSSASVPSFSASTARLIFARRLGLSQFHSLTQEDAHGEAIPALNVYGGVSDGLFGSKSAAPSRSLVFVEGYEDHNEILPEELIKNTMRFSIDAVPTPQENAKLIQDLQDQHTVLRAQQTQSSFSSSELVEIETLAKGHAGPNEEVKSHLKQLLDSDARPIIVLMDPIPTGIFSKRTVSNWGKYKTVMRRQSEFSSGRPDITPEMPVDPVEVEVAPEDEETLTSETSDRPSPDYDWVDVQQDDDDHDGEDRRNTTAPRGILPQCYTSESSCRKTTNDCSGHGSCKSKYRYVEGPKTVECFACRCDASSQGEGSAKSITYWSGPACQKRDVSTPFWLLSGITIGLVLVISWGIGLLYAMGQEELPSVIGAGVALPRPK
ncbi:hypothetical protein FH972_025931 [Carpinus fangiana]|uniref:Uncharacterized protein n=1 Tax=Carpinus fangiana TaxID=176857 RepID=A0A5N6L2F7_9ROSI|nr:hypothetical protein FH972_025931 [Carpinus fangiana]